MSKPVSRDGLEYTGYEDPELLAASDYLEFDNGDAFDRQLADALIISYRSVSAYDNTLVMMEERSQNIGVIEIGAGHYSSMREHAAEQGNANVIFFIPMEYDGPMPELQE